MYSIVVTQDQLNMILRSLMDRGARLQLTNAISPVGIQHFELAESPRSFAGGRA